MSTHDDSTEALPGERGRHVRTVVLAAVADVACVVALTLGGYRAHDEGSAFSVTLRIAWPFLTGLVLGWLLVRAWRRPTAAWPTGVIVWGCTWAGGIGLRAATGQGIDPAFQLVSFGFLAFTVVGWRGVVSLIEVLSPRERRRRAAALRGTPRR
ncbi:DUF3054 domain-containing protein [Cellulomonas sp. PhB143]|uniref:DUF3054 domain-containing protein n=1 Tax=Cellulomonas sp. PhB143 TaxID=2485186 RepID=UPI000F4A1F2E|nr:DUF3054 domain-containing protein [Cellulomonas sp. PhB143]ROS77015.1 DUF3054 family protein [Cellulomonas sp. PhB143]